jgi:hypothetical protein
VDAALAAAETLLQRSSARAKKAGAGDERSTAIVMVSL